MMRSAGMHPGHGLAREAIQNSVDAALEGAPKVLVKFRAASVANSAKKAFIEATGLADIAERIDLLDLPRPNCLQSLDKPRTALQLLYIDDYHSVGLSGGAHDKGSNFYRLLLSLGDRSKNRSSKGTGGSYGFGKSVYSSSSAIQTIFAYTRFVDDSGEEQTRIFGCGYYASHIFGGDDFSGRAWFGVVRKRDAQGRTVVDPVEGNPANKLAEALGFELRKEGSLGTSILIVDAEVDVKGIVTGVEEWWWPRLIEHKLDVEVHDADGNVHIPRPRKNDAIRPFIDAFDIARQRATPKTGMQKFFRLNNQGTTPLGTCGFVVAPVDAQGAPFLPSERSNSVALIRAPLMVVAYKPFSETAPAVVGTYVAPDVPEVDLVLKKSEPPAHDRWDPESTNLRDESGASRELVGAVLSRIRGGLRRFQHEAAPPSPPKQRRLTQLERALGRLFKPQGHGGARPPESTPSPLHLEFSEQPHAEPTPEGLLKLKAVFTVTLDDKSEESEVDLRLRVNCPIMEDDNEEGDDLKLQVMVSGVAASVDEGDPWAYQFLLAKNQKARFSVLSEAYDSAWTVRLRPDMDKAGD